MPLFTDPILLNDGNADRSFSFRAQLNEGKTVVGEWVEPAAELSQQSGLIVKHDTSKSTTARRLLQRTAYLHIADGTFKKCTVNITVQHHPEHTLADITKQVNIIKDAVSEATFVNNFLKGLI